MSLQDPAHSVSTIRIQIERQGLRNSSMCSIRISSSRYRYITDSTGLTSSLASLIIPSGFGCGPCAILLNDPPI